MRFVRLISLLIVSCIAPIAASLHFDKNYAGKGYGSYSRNFAPENADQGNKPQIRDSSASNLGCFLCTQMLAVTEQRVGLSQAQLKIVLNDRCNSLPRVVRSQCYAFVGDSLPQIYVSLTYNMPTRNICEILNLCDFGNPFAKETTTEPASTTTTAPESSRVDFIGPKKLPQKTYNIITTTPPSARPLPGPEGEKIPEFKQLLAKSGDTKTHNKRLTCLFCERMLTNAKNYALAAKSEIGAFANASCSKLRESALIEQCYQLTDRKINELAIFVDEQVVEALWCAQMNHC